MADAIELLGSYLPIGWTVQQVPRLPGARDEGFDGIWEIAAPDARRTQFLVEAKGAVEPRAAAQLIDRIKRRADGPWLVVARHLSGGARTRLAEAGVSYVDLTGNVDVRNSEPGLAIRAQGSARDPSGTPRSVSSLRGARAAWIVRDLIEHRHPGTVRDIAARSGADLGYVSRVLTFLDTQALVSRSPRGELLEVVWTQLLRRWATDAPVPARARALRYLAPRGLDDLTRRLVAASGYAVTGALAAARVASIAPTRLARVYVDNARAFSTALGLRATDAGVNVILLEVDDELALRPGGRPDWHGHADHVRYASPVNVVADLLGGVGREPEEGDALLEWMQANEGAWRV